MLCKSMKLKNLFITHSFYTPRRIELTLLPHASNECLQITGYKLPLGYLCPYSINFVQKLTCTFPSSPWILKINELFNPSAI